jgi:transcription initiation factor TFIIH subunit 4
MSVLDRLHILSLVPEPPIPRAYRLHHSFAQSLRQALTGGGSTQSFGVPCDTPAKNPASVDQLDAWARGQWESILYYMVGSTGAGMGSAEGKISQGTKWLLSSGSFVSLKHDRATITKNGFTFLLQESNAQVWSLLIIYLENYEAVRSLQIRYSSRSNSFQGPNGTSRDVIFSLHAELDAIGTGLQHEVIDGDTTPNAGRSQ